MMSNSVEAKVAPALLSRSTKKFRTHNMIAMHPRIQTQVRKYCIIANPQEYDSEAGWSGIKFGMSELMIHSRE